jgi:hypothetical protein
MTFSLVQGNRYIFVPSNTRPRILQTRESGHAEVGCITFHYYVEPICFYIRLCPSTIILQTDERHRSQQQCRSDLTPYHLLPLHVDTSWYP